MVSLAGLSAAFPGYSKARESGSQSELSEFELQKGQGAYKALNTIGDAILQMDFPGAQPIPGMGMGGGPPVPPGGAPGPATAQGAPPPQPPMQPGQPSVPMAPASWAPGGAFPAAGGGMLQGGNQRLSQALQGAQPQPSPQGAPSPAAPPPAWPPQGMPQQGQMDLPTFVRMVKRTNPRISGTEMAQAVIQALPIFNQESRQMLGELNARFKGEGLDIKEDLLRLQADRLRQQNEQFQQTQQRLAGSRNPQSMIMQKYIEEHPEATAEDMAKFAQTLKPPTAGSARATEKTQAAEAERENVLSQIDSALTQLKEAKTGGPPVTGIMGKGRRYLEGIGGTLGWTSATEASEFEQKIRLLQAKIPRMLAGTRITNKEERDKLDQIVRGLGNFTSPDMAIKSLEYLQKVIKGTVGSEKLQQTPASGGGAVNIRSMSDDDLKRKLGIP